jgi:hypothetical protein
MGMGWYEYMSQSATASGSPRAGHLGVYHCTQPLQPAKSQIVVDSTLEAEWKYPLELATSSSGSSCQLASSTQRQALPLFSNRSKHRPLLPRPDARDPAAPAPDAAVPAAPQPLPPDPPPRRRHLAWAKLIRRVLDIDGLSCPRCAVPMVVLAFITDPPTLRKILDHLGLPSSPPLVLPARNAWEEFPIDDRGAWPVEDQQSLPDIEGQLGDPPDSS